MSLAVRSWSSIIRPVPHTRDTSRTRAHNQSHEAKKKKKKRPASNTPDTPDDWFRRLDWPEAARISPSEPPQHYRILRNSKAARYHIIAWCLRTYVSIQRCRTLVHTLRCISPLPRPSPPPSAAHLPARNRESDRERDLGRCRRSMSPGRAPAGPR